MKQASSKLQHAPAYVERLAPWPSVAQASQGLTAFIFTIITLGVFLVAGYLRGPWIDEFWTLWMASGSRNVSEAFTERWLLDPHPPAFSWLNWLMDPYLSSDVVQRRYLNLLPAWLCVMLAVRFWHAMAQIRDFIVIFSIALLSSYPFMNGFTEYRSYFTQSCVAFALVLALYALNTPRSGKSLNRTDHLFIALAIFWSLNLHYVSAFISGCIIGAFVAVWFMEGRRGLALAVLTGTALNAIPLVTFFLFQRQFMEELPARFWIDTDLTHAVLYLGLVGLRGAASNLPLVAVAAAAIVPIVLARKLNLASRSALRVYDLKFVLIMTSGGLIAALTLFLVNLHTPIIIDRYLNVLTVAACAVLAALSAPLMTAHRLLFALFILNASLVIAMTGWRYSHEQRWDATAAQLRLATEDCPALAITAWVSEPGFPFSNNEKVRRLAYESVASRHRLEIGFEQDGRLALTPSPLCGSAIWLEHVPDQYKTIRSAGDMTNFLKLPIDRKTVSRARLFRGDTGFVLFYGGRT